MIFNTFFLIELFFKKIYSILKILKKIQNFLKYGGILFYTPEIQIFYYLFNY